MIANSIKFTAAAAALSLAPALAATETDQRTTGVTYSDLDLTTAEGIAELDRRIERAAQTVCGVGEHEVGSRIRSRETRQCMDEAMRQLDRHFAQIKREASQKG